MDVLVEVISVVRYSKSDAVSDRKWLNVMTRGFLRKFINLLYPDIAVLRHSI